MQTVDIEIAVLDRGRIETDLNFPLEAARTATRDRPNPDFIRGEGVVYNLVLDGPDTTLLWDTGIHPDAAADHWPDDLANTFTPSGIRPLEADLDEAGYGLSDLDGVIQSHLHCDHAGGLDAISGTELPVLIHVEEFGHAYLSAKTDAGDDAYLAADFDHDLEWEIVRGDRVLVADGIEMLHLPGHTPGLTGLLVHRDPPLLFTGDQAYVAANYEEDHPLGAGLLWSRPDWLESQHRLRNLERRHEATVVYGHDPEQYPEIADGWS